MKKKEIMKKSKEELEKLYETVRKELFAVSSSSLAGEDNAKKRGKIRALKKTIARIKTRLNN